MTLSVLRINYRESSPEPAGNRLLFMYTYIAMKFHNNLTKAKFAKELITSVESLDILHLNLHTLLAKIVFFFVKYIY